MHAGQLRVNFLIFSCGTQQLPEIGALTLKRLLFKFRDSDTRTKKSSCLAVTDFIAHLVNQNVVNVAVLPQVVLTLLNDRTDDSIEIAVGLLKNCRQQLMDGVRTEPMQGR